jgi:hypothetical protein
MSRFVRRMVVVLCAKKTAKKRLVCDASAPGEKVIGIAGGAASLARTILHDVSLLTGKNTGIEVWESVARMAKCGC